jgi:ABC-type Fe3+ transport system permease subunit
MSIAISFLFSGSDEVAQRRRRHQDTSSMQSPPTRPTWRRIIEVAVPALLFLVAGLTMVFIGLNDPAAGSTIIRASGKPTVVAMAVGPLASDFRWHVWSSVVVGGMFIVVAAALLIVLRFGSSAARERLLAFNERSRYGNDKPPSWGAQIAAVLAVVAIMVWLLKD